MTDRLSHRGPDADVCFLGDEVALGHRRLSIIDLSETANQPIFDTTGRYAIILNGEIYNYRDVKANLPDYQYKTNGDAEDLIGRVSVCGPWFQAWTSDGPRGRGPLVLRWGRHAARQRSEIKNPGQWLASVSSR